MVYGLRASDFLDPLFLVEGLTGFGYDDLEGFVDDDLDSLRPADLLEPSFLVGLDGLAGLVGCVVGLDGLRPSDFLDPSFRDGLEGFPTSDLLELNFDDVEPGAGKG